MNPLTLAYSPCPNDTYIFHAWVHGLVPDAPPVREVLEDIDMLNAMALRGEPHVVKVSFHAFAHLRDRYALLHAGGALGRGCGPLVVVRPDSPLRLTNGSGPARLLAGCRVAIPGTLTTAAMLLRLYAPDVGEQMVMPFDTILAAVERGDVDAGLIIHESRFTYQKHGLRRLVDLGEWWEGSTGFPIPLGGIAVRRDLGIEVAGRVDRTIRRSLELARDDPDASSAYIQRHAQEMDPDVCREHIALYVNDFSLDYGREGEAAIRHLLSLAEEAGTAPAWAEQPLFWDDLVSSSGG
ncbi:MAG: 1,4-dihydroxy-6-naphthoate synthase [Thermoleophilia bacterium]